MPDKLVIHLEVAMIYHRHHHQEKNQLILAYHHHAVQIQCVEILVIELLVHALKITLEPHPTADPNVLLTQIAQQPKHVLINAVSIPVQDLAAPELSVMLSVMRYRARVPLVSQEMLLSNVLF